MRRTYQSKSRSMKKLVIVFFIFGLSLYAKAQEVGVNWMTLDEALIAQQEAPRKIIMDMYTTWCGPCKLLDKNTFQNKDVATYINENYYAVKFNAEGNTEVSFHDKKFSNPNFIPNKQGRNSQHQLASYLGVNAYPTVIFLDESSELLFPLRGYQNPSQLELFLKLFATDKYKEITSKEQFQQYTKEFIPEFKP